MTEQAAALGVVNLGSASGPVEPPRAPDIAAILALVRSSDLHAALRLAQAQIDLCGKVTALLQPMGEILLRLGQNDEALVWLEDACSAQPDHLDALNQRGMTLSRLLRYSKAHQAYLQALRVGPQVPALFANIGANLNKAQDFKQAELWLRKGLALKADAQDVQANLANALIGQGRMDEAQVLVKGLLQNGFQVVEVLQAHATLLNAAGKFVEAEALVRQLLQQDPGNESLCLLLFMIMDNLGRSDEKMELMQRLLATDLQLDAVQSSLVFTLNYSEAADAAELLKQARRYGAMLRKQQAANDVQPYPSWRIEPQPAMLRVGLVSGDFRDHPVGYFLDEVVPALRGSRIELFAYQTMDQEDALTQRMRPHFAQWRRLVGLENAQAAKLIHEDGVHVLVDLSGHTRGHRLPVFALKPAPVQATWLGYLGTTGVPEIDWVIADAHIAPAGTEKEFVEGIWRMPESYVHLSPPVCDIKLAGLPALDKGHITFGNFNNLAKMTDAVVALWARVLHAVPGSRLFLKCPQLQASAAVQRTQERFALHGISAEQLTLEGPSPRAALLDAYNRVDIALDPFPYTGGTTSLEALWMSVPVLTLRGDRFMSRMGVTLMTHAGLPDWIAENADHLVQLAVAHSRDLNRLAEVRSDLRARVLASPLMDTARFAQQVEAALCGMWRHWQKTATAAVIVDTDKA